MSKQSIDKPRRANEDDMVFIEADHPEKSSTGQENHETREQRMSVADVISDPALTTQTALEVLASADPAAKQEAANERLNQTLKSYGVQPDEIVPEKREQLLLLTSSLDRARSQNSRKEMGALIQRKMHEQMVELALMKIDDLGEQLYEAKSDPKAVESKLRDFMDTVGRLSKQLPVQDQTNAAYWEQINGHFKAVISTKQSSDKIVSRVMSKVFDEFSDFIEDEILSREIQRLKDQGGYYDYEEVMQNIYGRSAEETEEQKVRNRERVAATMEVMGDKPYVTTDMLLQLYIINNRGIAAKAMQRLRGGDELITFGKRMGTLPEDVQEEMNGWEQRVGQTIDQALLENWSDSRYQIVVAQLHNEFLEIHPFPDRNGSTGVMFMELMMMRRGYKPPRERQNNYYMNVAKILDHNPLALGIIGYEMARIKYEWGYYSGKTSQNKEYIYHNVLTDYSGGEYKPGKTPTLRS